MPSSSRRETIGAIVPTIGRPEALRQLLASLARQSRLPDEVIVADASADDAVGRVCDEPEWLASGLRVRRVAVARPNAVAQRRAAIATSTNDHLLLLDDDVVLEVGCVAALLDALGSAPQVVAVTADFNNQTWPGPTTMWRWYLRWVHRLTEGQWQGRVVGPLLRFGYRPSPAGIARMEWLGAGNSLVRRSAYDRVGGFSDFFLHRSTINEDVDLGLKLGRVGHILLNPEARMAHLHAPGGRVSARAAAEDDLYNRYLILCRTKGLPAWHAFALVAIYFLIETISNLGGCLRRLKGNGSAVRLAGRLSAFGRILSGQPSRGQR